MDKRVFLKVKLKSLSAEARVIKHEEQKRKVRRDRYSGCMSPGAIRSGGGEHCKQECRYDRSANKLKRKARRAKDWYPMSAQELHELHRHRLDVVRVEARLTHIAYGFIRGRRLRDVDASAVTTVFWPLDPVAKAGRYEERVKAMVKKFGDPQNQDVDAWVEASVLKGELGKWSGFEIKQAAAAAG